MIDSLLCSSKVANFTKLNLLSFYLNNFFGRMKFIFLYLNISVLNITSCDKRVETWNPSNL